MGEHFLLNEETELGLRSGFPAPRYIYESDAGNLNVEFH